MTGKDDPIIDGDIGSEIIISIDDVRSDITYRTVLPTSVVVINEDNDDLDGDGVKMILITAHLQATMTNLI